MFRDIRGETKKSELKWGRVCDSDQSCKNWKYSLNMTTCQFMGMGARSKFQRREYPCDVSKWEDKQNQCFQRYKLARSGEQVGERVGPANLGAYTNLLHIV